MPEQGRGVMGHNLVDAEDQNAKSRLGLCMEFGSCWNLGRCGVEPPMAIQGGQVNAFRHKLSFIIYLSNYLSLERSTLD